MEATHPFTQLRQRFIAVLNNPVFDQTSEAHVQEFIEVTRQKMKIGPAQMGRLIVKNWEYRPGRSSPPSQTAFVQTFNAALKISANSPIAPLQYLKPLEIAEFLEEHPEAKELYHEVKKALWRFKVRQDFPAREKTAIEGMQIEFNDNPLNVYSALAAPARYLAVNNLVSRYRRGYNFWGAEEWMEEIDEFFYVASKQIGPNLKSGGILAGDIIWFNQYGMGGVWDGKRIQMPKDYAEDEAHLPEWIQFPDFPIDHYSVLVRERKWPDFRLRVPLSKESEQEALNNWDEASQTTFVTGPLDVYFLEIHPMRRQEVARVGFKTWFPGVWYNPVSVRIEDGKYLLM